MPVEYIFSATEWNNVRGSKLRVKKIKHITFVTDYGSIWFTKSLGTMADYTTQSLGKYLVRTIKGAVTAYE